MTDATILALPRVVPDSQCDSYETALTEARRRSTETSPPAVTRIRKSPYGGYVVVSVPARVMAKAIRAARGSTLIHGVSGYYEE